MVDSALRGSLDKTFTRRWFVVVVVRPRTVFHESADNVWATALLEM